MHVHTHAYTRVFMKASTDRFLLKHYCIILYFCSLFFHSSCHIVEMCLHASKWMTEAGHRKRLLSSSSDAGVPHAASGRRGAPSWVPWAPRRIISLVCLSSCCQGQESDSGHVSLGERCWTLALGSEIECSIEHRSVIVFPSPPLTGFPEDVSQDRGVPAQED